jgi:iron complex transport system substrate-binding protein
MKAIALALCLAVLAIAPAQAQDTRSFTDDLGRVVDIPANPHRIAALDDLRLSVPLIELGVTPIASHGRSNDDQPYIRSGLILTGVDFATSDIAFLGNEPIDIEALAAAAPDLIVTLVSRDVPLDQLERIAPTVVFDEAISDRFEIYARLADLTGSGAMLARLEARYQAQLAQLQRLVDAPGITVSVMEGSGGAISVQHSYGSLGKVLRDAGFRFPALIDAIPEGGEQELSAELLADLDADVIFDTFRGDRGETPANADERMREVLPDYCTQLWACRNEQYFRLPRDEAYAISYQSLSSITTTLVALMSSQTLRTRGE